MDGLFHLAEKGGIGAIVRNEISVFLTSFARSLPSISSTWNVEAVACRAGLLISIH